MPDYKLVMSEDESELEDEVEDEVKDEPSEMAFETVKVETEALFRERIGRFVVVEFEDGLQLVPGNWIDKKTLVCVWPNVVSQLRLKKMIAGEAEPTDSWTVHSIIQIFCSADSYKRGIEKLRLAEKIANIYSCMESEDEEEKKRAGGERIRKRGLSPSSLDCEPDAKRAAGRDETAEPPILPGGASRRVTRSHPPETLVNSTNTSQVESPQICCNSGDDQRGILKEILKKVNFIYNKVRRNEQRLKHLETNLLLENVSDDDNTAETQSLPLNTTEELIQFSQKLDDKEFWDGMVKRLKRIGGTDAHTVTVGILKTLLTNAVASLYSYAGAKKKLSFKEFNIAKLVIETVRHHHSSVTDAEVSEYTAKWLVQAKSRLARENRKTMSLSAEMSSSILDQ